MSLLPKNDNVSALAISIRKHPNESIGALSMLEIMLNNNIHEDMEHNGGIADQSSIVLEQYRDLDVVECILSGIVEVQTNNLSILDERKMQFITKALGFILLVITHDKNSREGLVRRGDLTKELILPCLRSAELNISVGRKLFDIIAFYLSEKCSKFYRYTKVQEVKTISSSALLIARKWVNDVTMRERLLEMLCYAVRGKNWFVFMESLKLELGQSWEDYKYDFSFSYDISTFKNLDQIHHHIIKNDNMVEFREDAEKLLKSHSKEFLLSNSDGQISKAEIWNAVNGVFERTCHGRVKKRKSEQGNKSNKVSKHSK